MLTRRVLIYFACAITVLCYHVSCSRPEANRFQGYVEGEFVYVASPLSGAVESLYVRRGEKVKVGDPLFALDKQPEKDARDEAQRRLVQARATWEDLKKPRRPTEIASIEAQLNQARAAFVFSDKELLRQEKLVRTGARTPEDLDRAISQRDQDRDRVKQLEADLATARLGSRTDQIDAAEANLKASEAALAIAEWNLAQKRQVSPKAGEIFDTLYREGDWVAAGRPVVALLPPENVKVRAFIPETIIGKIQTGDMVKVFVDGVTEPYVGKVSFISPRAEYTPPVIYSQESRAKLVFMVEIRFDPKTASNLHPGQPVDVKFGFKN